jgi:osmotically-inducible protein OsmY
MTGNEFKRHVQDADVEPGGRALRRVKSTDVRDRITDALKRSAEIDARRIDVTAEDGRIILSGNVHSWAEREEAERAAWATPGVTNVEDRLTVVP